LACPLSFLKACEADSKSLVVFILVRRLLAAIDLSVAFCWCGKSVESTRTACAALTVKTKQGLIMADFFWDGLVCKEAA
jgi:hypothetical protein